MRSMILVACAGGILTFCCPVNGQASKDYRGSIGGSHVEMHLIFEGNKVSGTYAYDRVGEDLKLSGQIGAQGGLELAEFDAKRKQTGKITCKRSLDDPIDPDCTWSRVDGAHQAYISLEEQNLAFTNGMQVIARTIVDRTTGVTVSYPQLISDKPSSGAVQGFNGRILASVKKAIKDFEPQPIAGRTSFEINYRVLLGTSDLISVEMNEYSDAGGAHPNTGYWALTYDLKNNKELEIEDIFKPDSDYRTAIANYVVTDIDRRADAIEQEDAKRENRKPVKRDASIVSADQLSELSGWSLTPKGLMVYFDFPHVIAAFDRTFVPYSIVREYLQPNVPFDGAH